MYCKAPNEEPEIFAARLIGRIENCTNPESAELLGDGETFVFGNCALMVGHAAYREGRGIVYLKDQAFVSRARIVARDRVEIEDRRMIEGLTGTLGCDVLPIGTERFPAGTVFMCEGANPVTELGSDTLIDPADTRPRLIAFDPLAGALLGEIPLGPQSDLARGSHRIDQPNGLAINAAGDVFFGDIPNGNPVAQLPSPVPSAIYRVPHSALDAIASGEDGTASVIERIETPGFVNGLTVSKGDDTLWMVSCSEHDPVEGGCYRITLSDFARQGQPDPPIAGLGIIDGVGVTRRGTVLASTPRTGEVHAFHTDGRHQVVRLEQGSEDDRIVRMPADFNVCYPKVLDGEPALLVTDISVGKAPGDASVAVVDISGL